MDVKALVDVQLLVGAQLHGELGAHEGVRPTRRPSAMVLALARRRAGSRESPHEDAPPSDGQGRHQADSIVAHTMTVGISFSYGTH